MGGCAPRTREGSARPQRERTPGTRCQGLETPQQKQHSAAEVTGRLRESSRKSESGKAERTGNARMAQHRAASSGASGAREGGGVGAGAGPARRASKDCIGDKPCPVGPPQRHWGHHGERRHGGSRQPPEKKPRCPRGSWAPCPRTGVTLGKEGPPQGPGHGPPPASVMAAGPQQTPGPQVTHHPIPRAGSSSRTRTMYSRQVSSFREKLNSRILRPAGARGQGFRARGVRAPGPPGVPRGLPPHPGHPPGGSGCSCATLRGGSRGFPHHSLFGKDVGVWGAHS